MTNVKKKDGKRFGAIVLSLICSDKLSSVYFVVHCYSFLTFNIYLQLIHATTIVPPLTSKCNPTKRTAAPKKSALPNAKIPILSKPE